MWTITQLLGLFALVRHVSGSSTFDSFAGSNRQEDSQYMGIYLTCKPDTWGWKEEESRVIFTVILFLSLGCRFKTLLSAIQIVCVFILIPWIAHPSAKKNKNTRYNSVIKHGWRKREEVLDTWDATQWEPFKLLYLYSNKKLPKRTKW